MKVVDRVLDWVLNHFRVYTPQLGFPVVCVWSIGTSASRSAAMNSQLLPWIHGSLPKCLRWVLSTMHQRLSAEPVKDNAQRIAKDQQGRS